MTWVLALGVAVIFAVMAFLFAVAMPRFKKLQTLVDKINLVTREILTGIMVIRAFSTEKHEEERFEEANRNLTRTNLFVNRCMTFMMPVMMLIMNGLTVLIVYTGARGVDEGAVQVGSMMAFIQYTMQIIMAFLMIAMVAVFMPRASVSASRVNEVLETEPSIRNPESTEMPDPERRGELEFRSVSFAYPGAEEDVLTDVSFTARRGETVAFIGSTGSGKEYAGQSDSAVLRCIKGRNSAGRRGHPPYGPEGSPKPAGIRASESGTFFRNYRFQPAVR